MLFFLFFFFFFFFCYYEYPKTLYILPSGVLVDKISLCLLYELHYFVFLLCLHKLFVIGDLKVPCVI